MDVAELRRIDLFRGLPEKDLRQVAQWTDEVEVDAGRVLARDGDLAYEFFVIEEGAAEVTVDGETVAKLGPGEWFGEIGLLTDGRRTATVTATSPMRLAVVFGPSFRALTQALPDVAATIEAELRQRLERA